MIKANKSELEKGYFDISIGIDNNKIYISIHGVDKSKCKVSYKSGLKTIVLKKNDGNYKIIKSLIKEANISLGLTDYKEAIVNYKNVLDLDPLNNRIWSNLGYVYYKIGELDEAYRAYEKSLELREDSILFSRLSLLLANAFNQGDFELSLKIHNIFLLQNPQKFEYKYLFGVIHGFLEKGEKAYKIFNELLQTPLSDFDLKKVVFMLCSILDKKSDFKKMIQLCREQIDNLSEIVVEVQEFKQSENTVKLRVIDAYKKKKNNDLGKGRIRIDSNIVKLLNLQNGDAIEVINPITKLKTAGSLFSSKPEDTNAGVIRLDSQLRRNIGVVIDGYVEICKIQTEFAEEVKLRCIKESIIINSSQLTKLLENRVITKGDILSFFSYRKKYELEVTDYSPKAKSVQVQPNTLFTILPSPFLEMELFAQLSYAYNQIGEHGNAIEAANNAIKLNKTFADPWAHLGYAYYKQGKSKAAISFFEKSISMDEKFAYPHYYLGLMQYELKDYQKAQEHCEKALEIDPEYEKALILKEELLKLS